MLNGFFGYLESQLLKKSGFFFGFDFKVLLTFPNFSPGKKNFKSEMVGEILDELEKLIIMEMSIKIKKPIQVVNGHVWHWT